MQESLLIEPHYLGSLEYFVLIRKYKSVIWEVNQHFIKQTYRNRAVILTAGGLHNLIVPVKYGNRSPFKDVKVDYSQRWVKDQWGAIYSAYGKSPFFEYFAPDFQDVWERKTVFLLDLCQEMMSLCLSYLQIDREIAFTNFYEKQAESPIHDYRELIHPKKSFNQRSNYYPFHYFQNFGREFVPNLSVVDLLFSLGQESVSILEKSTIGSQ